MNLEHLPGDVLLKEIVPRLDDISQRLLRGVSKYLHTLLPRLRPFPRDAGRISLQQQDIATMICNLRLSWMVRVIESNHLGAFRECWPRFRRYLLWSGDVRWPGIAFTDYRRYTAPNTTLEEKEAMRLLLDSLLRTSEEPVFSDILFQELHQMGLFRPYERQCWRLLFLSAYERCAVSVASTWFKYVPLRQGYKLLLNIPKWRRSHDSAPPSDLTVVLQPEGGEHLGPYLCELVRESVTLEKPPPSPRQDVLISIVLKAAAAHGIISVLDAFRDLTDQRVLIYALKHATRVNGLQYLHDHRPDLFMGWTTQRFRRSLRLHTTPDYLFKFCWLIDRGYIPWSDTLICGLLQRHGIRDRNLISDWVVTKFIAVEPKPPWYYTTFLIAAAREMEEH